MSSPPSLFAFTSFNFTTDLANAPLSLTLQKTSTADGQTSVPSGTSVGYTLTITRSGSDTSPITLTVTDVYTPAGNVQSCTLDNSMSWTLLQTGGTLTFTSNAPFTGTIPSINYHCTLVNTSSSQVCVTNTASAAGTTANNTAASNPDTHIVCVAPASSTTFTLTLQKTSTADGQAPVPSGTSVGYTLTITRSGSDTTSPIPANSLVVTDTYTPAANVQTCTLDPSSTANWTLSQAGGVLTFKNAVSLTTPIPSINYHCTLVNPSSSTVCVTNSASATANNTVTSNTDKDIICVTPAAAAKLELIKTNLHGDTFKVGKKGNYSGLQDS